MELHWILTLEVPGLASLTRYGTWNAEPGSTRSTIFNQIRGAVAQDHPELTRANTVFWSLEPNQL